MNTAPHRAAHGMAAALALLITLATSMPALSADPRFRQPCNATHSKEATVACTDVTAARGDRGERGERGDRGEKGERGDRGETGLQGVQGPAGPQGLPGSPGQDGTRGPAGEPGARGPSGERGPAGEKGVKGDRGEKGEKGDIGPAGPAGPAGQQGVATGCVGGCCPGCGSEDRSQRERAATAPSSVEVFSEGRFGTAGYVAIVALVMLAAGLYVLVATVKNEFPSFFRRHSEGPEPPTPTRRTNPLRPYALQILGLTFVLPVLLVLSVTAELRSETVSALLGAMIAFVFGNGRLAAEPRSDPPTQPPRAQPETGDRSRDSQ